MARIKHWIGSRRISKTRSKLWWRDPWDHEICGRKKYQKNYVGTNTNMFNGFDSLDFMVECSFFRLSCLPTWKYANLCGLPRLKHLSFSYVLHQVIVCWNMLLELHSMESRSWPAYTSFTFYAHTYTHDSFNAVASAERTQQIRYYLSVLLLAQNSRGPSRQIDLLVADLFPFMFRYFVHLSLTLNRWTHVHFIIFSNNFQS